jgi:hypothetical protein
MMATMSEVIAERRTTLQISSEELALRINESSRDRVSAFEAGTLVLDEGTESRLLTALGFSAVEMAALQKGPRVPPLHEVLMRRRIALKMRPKMLTKHTSINTIALRQYENGEVALRPCDVRDQMSRLMYSNADIDLLSKHELTYWPRQEYEVLNRKDNIRSANARIWRIEQDVLWGKLDVLRQQCATILATPEYYFSYPPSSAGVLLSRAFWPGGRLRLGEHVKMWFHGDAGGRGARPCKSCGATSYCSWCGGGLGSPFAHFKCGKCGACSQVYWGPVVTGTPDDMGALYRDLLKMIREYHCTSHIKVKSYLTVLKELGSPVDQALLDEHNTLIRDYDTGCQPLLYDHEDFVDLHGNCRLNVACGKGDVEQVRELLDCGHDVNGRKNPALLAAIENWNEEILRLLLDRGAEVTPAIIQACQEKAGNHITRYEWALGLFYQRGIAREQLTAYANVRPPGAAYVPSEGPAPSKWESTFSLKKGGRQYPVSILLGSAADDK